MNRSRTMWFVGSAVVVAGALMTTVGFAGFKQSQAVVIVPSSRLANGDLGYVHNTPDPNEMIYCQTVSTTSGTSVSCFARNSSGVTASCYSTNPEIVANAQSLDSSGYLVFWYNENGQCTRILSSHSSTTRPKAP